MKNYLLCGLLVAVIIALFPVYAKATLSSDAQELKTLYQELQEFKDNPEFHQVGFGTCCRFNRWMVKVEVLRSKKTGIKILMEVGFVPGELLQLGMEYMRSRGRPTSYTKEMEPVIVSGFAPEPQLKEGQGVIVTTDRGCASMDSIKKWGAALVAKKFNKAGVIIHGPDCPRVYAKTVVTGPLASEDLFLGDGSGSSTTFHQVKMPDGTRLRVMEGFVKFKSK